MLKNIGVIGVGGVGGYFGAKLCRLQESGGKNVAFLARGDHLREIQSTGLSLNSEEGEIVCKPSLATDNPEELPLLDLCLVCVKEFDLANVLRNLQQRIRPDTIVIPLLNGMDVYQRVRSALKHGVVFPACVYVGTHIEKPGKVVQKGGSCKILFGPDPQHPEVNGQEVTALFAKANIKCEWTDKIQTEIWKKFIFIASFGLVSAASGKTLGQIMDDVGLRGKVEAIMGEAIMLARQLDVELPLDIARSALEKAKSFPYETKTSFQRDFEKRDKPDERELFAGALQQGAAKLGLEVPTTAEMAMLIETKKPSRKR